MELINKYCKTLFFCLPSLLFFCSHPHDYSRGFKLQLKLVVPLTDVLANKSACMHIRKAESNRKMQFCVDQFSKIHYPIFHMKKLFIIK